MKVLLGAGEIEGEVPFKTLTLRRVTTGEVIGLESARSAMPMR